jgi:hypothetical protein
MPGHEPHSVSGAASVTITDLTIGPMILATRRSCLTN